MYKAIIFAFMAYLSISATYADVIPNPIAVKGIVPARPVNIQMVSECVTVDLYKDSSFVQCIFNMKNFGRAQTIEVGFPIMNFYLWNPNMTDPVKTVTDELIKSKFVVEVKARHLDEIDTYIPNTLINELAAAEDNKRYEILDRYTNANKPWYLWKVHFDKKEDLQIVVKYRLPCGSLKSNKFFNYLLSTGAGWKRQIVNAKVIVNLKDIPTDQILSVAPKSNFHQIGKQLIWNFNNLEPTAKDDILINYETVKGGYKAYIADIPHPAYYLNNKKISSKKILSINSAHIAKIDVVRNCPTEKDGAVVAYTNNYALQQFKKKIKYSDAKIWKAVYKETTKSFEKHYLLQINNKIISQNELFESLFDIYNLKIFHAEIKPENNKIKLIIITDSLASKSNST